MTNKEYLTAQLGFAASANAVEAALTDVGITGTSTYTVAASTSIKTAAIAVLKTLLSTADVTQGVGETANAIKYDRNAILKRIAMLEGELGINNSKPTIRGRSPW